MVLLIRMMLGDRLLVVDRAGIPHLRQTQGHMHLPPQVRAFGVLGRGRLATMTLKLWIPPVLTISLILSLPLLPLALHRVGPAIGTHTSRL